MTHNFSHELQKSTGNFPFNLLIWMNLVVDDLYIKLVCGKRPLNIGFTSSKRACTSHSHFDVPALSRAPATSQQHADVSNQVNITMTSTNN